MGYFSAFLLLPLLMTIASGTTLFLSTLSHTYLGELGLLTQLTGQLLLLLPFVIIIGIFTLLYLLIPNVPVRFVPALIAGTVAGLVFQGFQTLYISGVLWISKYNAIYGSFAAVPLALLWMQLSWVIVLLGAQISYAVQHVGHFTTPPLSEHPSRRYEDIVLITVGAMIARLFAEGHRPMPDVEMLAERCCLSLRQTQTALLQLLQMGLIIEGRQGDEEALAYYPALPLDQLTLGLLLERMDQRGAELLPLELEGRHRVVWQRRKQLYQQLFAQGATQRLCDLEGAEV